MVHFGFFLVSLKIWRFFEATTIDHNSPPKSSWRSLAGGAGIGLVMVACFVGKSWKWWADLTARCFNVLESPGISGMWMWNDMDVDVDIW